MPTSFAQVKLKMHRDVHSNLGVSATYQDDTVSHPVSITVRPHSKRIDQGEFIAGMAELSTGANRIVLDRSEAREIGVKRGGVIVITDYNITFRLGTLQPDNTNYREIWEVSR